MAQDEHSGGGGSHSSFPPDASETTVVSQAPSEVLEQMRAQHPAEPMPARPSDVEALGRGAGSAPTAVVPYDVPTSPHVPDLTLGEDEEDVDPNGPTMLRAAPPNAQPLRRAAGPVNAAGRGNASAAGFGRTVPLNPEAQASMRAHVQGARSGGGPPATPFAAPAQAPMGAPPQPGMGWQPAPPQHAQHAPSQASQSFQVAPVQTSGQPRWILLILVGGAAALVVFLVLGIIAFFLLNQPQPVRHV